MSISTDPGPANGNGVAVTSNGITNGHATKEVPTENGDNIESATAPADACGMRVADKDVKRDAVDHTSEFTGEVDTNNTLPSAEMISKVENLPVLDKDGRSIPFKSLYTGPNVARRVLVIFVRHFFCGVSLS
jgi:hypothetical protein